MDAGDTSPGESAPGGTSPGDTTAGEAPPPQSRRGRAVRGAIVVAVAVGLALVLRAFVIAPYYVPSQSMEPTLHGCPGCNDDHVLVDKLSYRFHDPGRGDIVVFQRPVSWAAVPDTTLIKRIVGLPGDTLSLRRGRLYVNGALLAEPYVNADCPPVRSLSGTTLASSVGPIPSGEYFVMGDNRCNSEDSRIFGPVPRADIVGRAFLTVWPLKRFGRL